MVSSTKGAIGHTLGAAGAIEAIFAILSISDGIVPPTLNLDPETAEGAYNGWGGEGYRAIRHVYDTFDAREKGGIAISMSHSFGFGGVNASLAFREPP